MFITSGTREQQNRTVQRNKRGSASTGGESYDQNVNKHSARETVSSSSSPRQPGRSRRESKSTERRKDTGRRHAPARQETRNSGSRTPPKHVQNANIARPWDTSVPNQGTSQMNNTVNNI